MENITNLLNKIADDDAVSTQKEFDKVLADKIAIALDKKKKEVSKNLFDDPLGVGAEEETETEEAVLPTSSGKVTALGRKLPMEKLIGIPMRFD